MVQVVSFPLSLGNNIFMLLHVGSYMPVSYTFMLVQFRVHINAAAYTYIILLQ